MRLRFMLAAASPLAVCSMARADLGYDAINAPFNLMLSFTQELADDTTLAPESGLYITGVTFRLRHVGAAVPMTGTLRARMYASGGAVPGTLLAESTVAASIPIGDFANIFVDMPNFHAASRSLWTSYIWEPDQQSASPLIGARITPVIGSTGPDGRYWDEAAGVWQRLDTMGGFAVQIHTAPAPPAAALLAILAVTASRRRR